MWLMTTEGFFSVISWHDGRMAVRARELEALERLRKLAPALSEIELSPGRDYRYRCFCSRDEWVALAALLAGRVDYGNFKDEVVRRQGLSRYEGVLHRVWSLMGDLQPQGPYGSRKSGTPRPPAGEKKLALSKPRTWPRSPASGGYFCNGRTKKGKPCRTRVPVAFGFCPQHVDQKKPAAAQVRELDAQLLLSRPEPQREQEQVCCECGNDLTDETGEVYGGEWWCSDARACMERVSAQRSR